MKSVLIVFTDEEHKKLVKLKRGRSWHDFVMQLNGGNKNGTPKRGN